MNSMTMKYVPSSSPQSKTGTMLGCDEVGGGLGLTAEPLDEGPVDRQLGEQDLQRHGPVEQPVAGPVDLGHSPAGDQVRELVSVGEDPRGLVSAPYRSRA